MLAGPIVKVRDSWSEVVFTGDPLCDSSVTRLLEKVRHKCSHKDGSVGTAVQRPVRKALVVRDAMSARNPSQSGQHKPRSSSTPESVIQAPISPVEKSPPSRSCAAHAPAKNGASKRCAIDCDSSLIERAPGAGTGVVAWRIGPGRRSESNSRTLNIRSHASSIARGVSPGCGCQPVKTAHRAIRGCWVAPGHVGTNRSSVRSGLPLPWTTHSGRCPTAKMISVHATML